MNDSTKYILDQLAPYATCDEKTWAIVEKQVEEHGWRDASASAQEQIKIAKAIWQKAKSFGSRSDAGRYAANIRWQGAGNAPGTASGAIVEAVAGAGAPARRNRDYSALTPQQQGQYRARPKGMSHQEAMRRITEGIPLREREGFRPATTEEAEALGVAKRWTDVLVSEDPKGVNGTTVMGIDAKGRPQVLQSAEKKAEASAEKFKRILELEKHMDKLDKRLEKGAKAGDEHALALSLVRRAGVRPGSSNDTKGSVQAFGATTLQARHVTIRGKVVTLDFIGKSGKRNVVKIRDQAFADAMTKQLGTKKNRDAVFPDVTASSLLAYQRTIIPKKFLLKDLRTSLGTKTALDAIAKMPAPTTQAEFKKARTAVGKIVAEKLGNTPSVALSAYINPLVFEYWQVGE